MFVFTNTGLSFLLILVFFDTLVAVDRSNSERGVRSAAIICLFVQTQVSFDPFVAADRRNGELGVRFTATICLL